MSANESTPAVSLREARQREAAARRDRAEVDHIHNRARVAAARRATDEALVRAVLRHAGQWVDSDWSLLADEEIAAVLDAVEAGGGGTMTTLPEAVEQAIHAADETNTRIAEAANGSDLTDLYTEWREALTALRAAILAYGAARERQGIERARGRLMEMVEEYGAMAEASASDEYRIKANGLGIAYVRLGALPVDGATP